MSHWWDSLLLLTGIWGMNSLGEGYSLGREQNLFYFWALGSLFLSVFGRNTHDLHFWLTHPSLCPYAPYIKETKMEWVMVSESRLSFINGFKLSGVRGWWIVRHIMAGLHTHESFILTCDVLFVRVFYSVWYSSSKHFSWENNQQQSNSTFYLLAAWLHAIEIA